MNVGVYCGQIELQAGGGHTFQMEILQSLAEFAGNSPHQFTLLVPSGTGFEKYTQSGHIKMSILPDFTPPLPRSDTRFQKRIKKWLGIEKVEIKPGGKSLPNHAKAFTKFLRKEDIHLLWLVGPNFEEVPDVPYLATVWDLQHRLQPFFPEVSSAGVWEYRETFFSKYLQRAAFVITGSRTGQLEIERFYQIPSERIKILPHPTPEFALIPPEIDVHAALERLGVQGDYLFYPAQFWAHKNHVNLLLALNILRKKYRLTPSIVFVGSDQGNEQHIRKIVNDLDLSVQVKILGFVSRDDLVALYKKAFALTYMTFFGPDNLPPLEAFAFGCPVIASEVSGAREQLDDAALFVKPTSPEEIADAIFLLYNDSEFRATLIERGSELAQRWKTKNFVNGVFDIMDEFEKVRRCWA